MTSDTAAPLRVSAYAGSCNDYGSKRSEKMPSGRAYIHTWPRGPSSEKLGLVRG